MVTPPIGAGQPPHLYELDEYTFQNLCRDLLYHEPAISTSDVYGRRGEPQLGIDLLAHREGDGVEVGQCKCYKNFPPSEIRDATDEFLKHWNRESWKP